MNNYLESFLDEDGQGLVEYGLLIILIALIVFAALQIFSRHVENFYNFDIPSSNDTTP